MKKILDACCGSRMFWFDKENKNTIFVDNREIDTKLCDGRRLIIKPDIIADFKDMPFEDNTFYLVIFDPPHLKQAGENIVLEKRFLNIKDFLDRAFEHDEEFRKIYKATLLKSGLKEIDEINIPDNVLKKYLRQKLITETGIEITIPIDYLNNSSLFNVKVEHSGAIVAIIQSNVLVNKE